MLTEKELIDHLTQIQGDLTLWAPNDSPIWGELEEAMLEAGKRIAASEPEPKRVSEVSILNPFQRMRDEAFVKLMAEIRKKS